MRARARAHARVRANACARVRERACGCACTCVCACVSARVSALYRCRIRVVLYYCVRESMRACVRARVRACARRVVPERAVGVHDDVGGVVPADLSAVERRVHAVKRLVQVEGGRVVVEHAAREGRPRPAVGEQQDVPRRRHLHAAHYTRTATTVHIYGGREGPSTSEPDAMGVQRCVWLRTRSSFSAIIRKISRPTPFCDLLVVGLDSYPSHRLICMPPGLNPSGYFDHWINVSLQPGFLKSI